MNPRQRRGVILLGLSIIGAISVFLSISNYVQDVRAEVGPLTNALRLTEDVPAFTEVTSAMIEEVPTPERWAPTEIFTDEAQMAGLVAGTDLPAGVVLQRGMLIERPVLQTGDREMAILVNAETGVAGKVGPGSRVDVYASFAGGELEPPRSVIAVQNALVLDVGVIQADTGAGEGFGTGERVVPVTFALSVEESLQLTYVDAFASAVRLVLRSSADSEEVPEGEREFQPIPRTIEGDGS